MKTLHNSDMPGLLELQNKVREQKWPHTLDARAWADEWGKAFANNPSIASDDGCMISWFANAIMAGYDTACSRAHGATNDLK